MFFLSAYGFASRSSLHLRSDFLILLHYARSDRHRRSSLACLYADARPGPKAAEARAAKDRRRQVLSSRAAYLTTWTMRYSIRAFRSRLALTFLSGPLDPRSVRRRRPYSCVPSLIIGRDRARTVVETSRAGERSYAQSKSVRLRLSALRRTDCGSVRFTAQLFLAG